MTEPLPISRINELPAASWRESLQDVLGVAEWIDKVGGARPYADRESLLALAEREALALTAEQVRRALADHPRIGAVTAPGSRAAHEQSGVDAADTELAERLRVGNLAYEAKFGHIYLVCAAGRGGPELLADLTTRLDNDPGSEILVTRAELAAIARKRLERLVTSGRSAITTHVLDTAAGHPARGIVVRLEFRTGEGWRELGSGRTDADGRVSDIGPAQVEAGDFRLTFDTAGYFGDRDHFFPEVTVTFTVADPRQHHHVPLLLSPFAMSTYRGS
ncbi:hydroxyisourate hydrolase [Nocardia sp. BMG51109]|uniref:hydroxyisourate hydrolase n=1 Tax=Nocardia sp. BMG51109 TaxID=1056816 RepID=UPI0004B9A909|nr:hydroxyisourate hydrolase [Nocardia sp. BMG51109]